MGLLIGIVALLFTIYVLWIVFQRHRGVTRWVFVEVVYNLIIKYLVGYLGFPIAFNYGSDLILIVILYQFLYHNERLQGKKVGIKVLGSLASLITLYFLVCVMSTLINSSSLLLFLWGFRNNYRFLIMLLVCSASLNTDDFYELSDILFAYLMLNVPVVIYQNGIMSTGYGSAYGDYVSGLFSNGTAMRGGNSALNWLMGIVCTFDTVRYLNSDQRLWHVLLSIGASLYLSAVSEMKLFLMELLIITVLSILLAKKSFRTLLVVVLVSAGVFVAIQVLYFLFPKFSGFFTFDGMIDYAASDSGYIGNETINRLNSLQYVFSKFLRKPTEVAFGIGFGNAEYSSRYAFLTSNFYKENSQTVYQWFSVPMILIETGILGLTCYILFALDIVRMTFTTRNKSMKERSLCQVSFIMVILAIISAVCNQSLRMEAMGFTVWLFLSMPYVVYRSSYGVQVQPSDNRVQCGWT